MLRAVRNTNQLIGIIMLILLLVLVGPNTLPRLLTRAVPAADEGVACDRLRSAENVGNHQSIIGRLADNPLSLEVDANRTADGLTIRITAINNSIGTFPIYYNPNQVIIGDNGTTGFGVIFSPANSLTIGSRTATPNSYNEDDIRLLGPRQRCVIRLTFTSAQVNADPAVSTAQSQVTAYYRVASAGAVTTGGTIFPDQGLRVPGGFIQSEPATISPVN